MTYKATNGVHTMLKNFSGLPAAEAYFQEVGLDSSYEITEASAGEQFPDKSDFEKLIDRRNFGVALLNTYLLDNDKIAAERGVPFSKAEAEQQAVKFQLIMAILPLGSIRQSYEELALIPTDSIFTQERKGKYLAMLLSFISSQ